MGTGGVLLLGYRKMCFSPLFLVEFGRGLFFVRWKLHNDVVDNLGCGFTAVLQVRLRNVSSSSSLVEPLLHTPMRKTSFVKFV